MAIGLGRKREPTEREARQRVRHLDMGASQQIGKVLDVRRSGVPLPEPLTRLLDELGRLKARGDEAAAGVSIRTTAVTSAAAKLDEARARAVRANEDDAPSVMAAERALADARAKLADAESRSQALARAVEDVEDETLALVSAQAAKWLAVVTRAREQAEQEAREHEAAAHRARRRVFGLTAAGHLFADAASSAGVNASSHKYDAEKLERAAASRVVRSA